MFDSAIKTGAAGAAGSVTNTKEAIKQGKKCMSYNKLSCVLMVAHGTQAYSSAAQAIRSFKTADGIKPNGYQMPAIFSGTRIPSNPNQLHPKLSEQLSSIIDQLEDTGYAIDQKAGTITIPPGKSLNVNSLKDRSKFIQAGFTSKDFDTLQAQMKESSNRVKLEYKKQYQKSIKQHQVKMAAIGQNKLKTNTFTNNTIEPIKMPDLSHFFTAKVAKQQTDVKGLSVIYGNEKIGVSGDSIFDMVKRQYSERKLKGMLLSEQ